MADKNILHMLTPTKHTSPFDVNMALDAGYDAVLTYNNVTLDEVTGLVQDAIFSRPPKVGARTGMFFGGKNASLALDMLAKAKKALVPPFGISFFADPAGSFTTAAAMLACVEKLEGEEPTLGAIDRDRHRRGQLCGGVIAALEGRRHPGRLTASNASTIAPRNQDQV
jgi:methylene-tetrahydromethanopterin dehydrogenase